MTKYHVNTEGDVAACRATKSPCPFGSELHFEDKAEAQQAAEQYISERIALEEFPKLHDPAEVEAQARIYFEEDQWYGRRNHPYRHYTDGDARRFKDYLAGFQTGVKLSSAEGPRAEHLWATNPIRSRPGTADEFDASAFRFGFARAQRMKDKSLKDENKGFLDHKISDYNVDHRQGAAQKYDDVLFLHNPFRAGEKILIPAGTTYTSGSGKSAVTTQTTKPQWVRIAIPSRGYVNGSVGKIFLHPAEISYAATPNAPWRHVVLTPELLSANGEKTYEAEPIGGDTFLTPLYTDA